MKHTNNMNDTAFDNGDGRQSTRSDVKTCLPVAASVRKKKGERDGTSGNVKYAQSKFKEHYVYKLESTEPR